LYRSGESEYLIDGAVCRLRDVHDLLMDAGLGVKAYAVIEQGKIGQILSSRPTERRQLIEEAAGVTKYKNRRRAAELKLEAAQQNLTRVDDIVYEVEKQRGALKRQAAKARRHRRLRDELRRWEKVVFAQQYRVLASAIESARARLEAAHARESSAAAHLAEAEATLERLRLELAEAETRASAAREAAHQRELEIGKCQQQMAFDRQQVASLEIATSEMAVELGALELRREPARLELEARRAAAIQAEADREAAAAACADAEALHQTAYRELEGLESDVEAARSEVFSALNAATALHHAVDHAATARDRIADDLAKLEVERADLAHEAERAGNEARLASTELEQGRTSLEALRAELETRQAALTSTLGDRELLAKRCRTLEQNVAALSARAGSLEELEAARAEYGDGARLVLAESNGSVGQLGSVADYLEVERGCERAVEAWLGDLLQHVLVHGLEHAAAGLDLVRQRDAGGCGFLLVTGSRPDVPVTSSPSALLRPMSAAVKVHGPYREAITSALGEAWIAETFEQAAAAMPAVSGPVATLAGEVFRGGHLVHGGTRSEARGILATKREIRELQARLGEEREALEHATDELATLDAAAQMSGAAIESLQHDIHAAEKAMVALEARLARAREDADRVARELGLVLTDRRHAEEELHALEARQAEAHESIRRLESEQRLADERFTSAQRSLFEAREAVERCAARVAEVKALHAALVERASGLTAEVGRLEASGRDLEERLAGRSDERQRALARKTELEAGIVSAERRLDDDVRAFEALKEQVRLADAACAGLHERFDAQDEEIREARRVLDTIRAELGKLEIARATAEGDLAHLAGTCLEHVQAPLDEVAAEVARLDAEGGFEAMPGLPDETDGDETEMDEGAGAEVGVSVPPTDAVPASAPTRVTPEEMVTALKAKIDRLGPVNMMAIEQFDDLESRHAFLVAQRTDLVESIASTGEAIRRIDRTTRERFHEAFHVINEHFAHTFTTLFGGGRAGLVLLDESDELESGIDIIAQPPGKRLQSVQLLSGGEKALTAMALMFALFKYRPSPFCLLDEIDAPLDDANIGRFVEMLQGMQDHTQFVLITHNRKTMEIADRLYGVTMEEPGVSKLISVQMN